MIARPAARQFLLALACTATLSVATTPALAREAATREWNFAVTLDGKPIGEHRYALRDLGNSSELTSEALFRVRFLFIEAYRYQHRARELWQGDCLQSLDARTDTNGKPVVVSIQTGSDPVLHAACVQTFAYWNPSILDAQRLLNPQTGEYMDVKVMPMGAESVNGQQTERYRLLGHGRTPLSIDLWYTAARDWVALESLTPEGHRLRYARK